MDIYGVYQKYNKDFLAFAKSRATNYSEAFDLVQDAYLAALENEEIFNAMNEYQIKGWFFTTIKNKNIDRIRKSNKTFYKDYIEIYNNEESFEEMVVLDQLIYKLPEKYRKVIILRYKMNLNSREIGEILNISPSTIRSQVSNALKILKDYL